MTAATESQPSAVQMSVKSATHFRFGAAASKARSRRFPPRAARAPLHFGTFVGLLSRVVWFALGLAMCYVTLTGLQLWLQRRAEDPLWRRLARATPVVGYGLPIAMGGAGWGSLMAIGNMAVVVFDVALLLAGTGFLIAGTGRRLPRVKAPRPADRVAAE